MKDLLELLALPDDYKGKITFRKAIEPTCKEIFGTSYNPFWSLADLAFRLRDEVCKDSLGCDNCRKALHIVWQVFRKSQEGTIRQNMVYYELWLESFITAEERVVAALIARRLVERK